MVKMMLNLVMIGVAIASCVVLPNQVEAKNSSSIAYQFFKDWDSVTPLNVHLVRVDLDNPQMKVGLALAHGSSNSQENVSRMAERNNALAAINGSFFQFGTSSKPSAVGLLMKDGQILADSRHRRTSLGITTDNRIIFGIPQITTGVYLRNQNIFKPVSGVNQPRKYHQTMVYTPFFGKRTYTNPFGREVIVRKNKIVGYAQGNSTIPRDGFVVSSHGKGKEIQKMYPLGSSIFLRARKYGPWADVHTLITGAPQLVHNGRIYNTYFQENLQPSLKTPNSRTAVGITPNNKLLFMTIHPTKGKGGATYTRLAQIMQRVGAVEAMGLDGGSSSALYVSTKGIQYDRRLVTNALIVTMQGKER